MKVNVKIDFNKIKTDLRDVLGKFLYEETECKPMIINIINEEGHVFGDKTTNKHNIRVSFNLSSDIIITNGIGTIDSPYALGVDNEKTEDTKEEEK